MVPFTLFFFLGFLNFSSESQDSIKSPTSGGSTFYDFYYKGPYPLSLFINVLRWVKMINKEPVHS